MRGRVDEPQGPNPAGVFAAGVVVRCRCARLILVVRRKRNEMVGIPCGKVDPGETARETAARELREETGVEVDPAELVYLGTFDTNDGHRTACYLAPPGDYAPEPRETPIAWVDRSVLLDPARCPWGAFNAEVFAVLDEVAPCAVE